MCIRDRTSHIIDYLNRALAPQITRHGVLMNIYGQGLSLIHIFSSQLVKKGRCLF